MSIVDELKQLIVARGGSVAGVRTIADAVKVLAVLKEADPSGTQTIAEGISVIRKKEIEDAEEDEETQEPGE